MDGGTTHAQLAAALPEGLRCTVVTHSPGIALSLEPNEGVEVVLLGGRLFRHSMGAMGAAAETVVLATPDKLGRASPWQIGGLGALATLITVGARPEGLPDTVAHLRA